MPGRTFARSATSEATNHKQACALVTAHKGFCYLTIKHHGRHHHMMRIRAYKIELDEKRVMRRLYPEVAFDWKKITAQLAEKREDCQHYRTRGRRSARRHQWEDGPPFAVYEPGSRTIFTNGIPFTAAGAGRLLDAVLQLDREAAEALRLVSDRTQTESPSLAAESIPERRPEAQTELKRASQRSTPKRKRGQDKVSP